MTLMTLMDRFKEGELVDPGKPLGALVYGIIFAVIAWLVGRALQLAVQRLVARDTRAYVDRTTVNFLAQLAKIGVYLFAFISYAHLVPALASLGSAWLTSVGVISVVLGLAAQNTLGNLIAGVSLVLYRPFKVGDRLHVSAPTGLEIGIVESVNLGYTVLKTEDNRRIVVPNSTIASQTTVNLSCEDPRTLCSVPIGISADSDLDKARAILLELARQHAGARDVCGCPVTQVGPGGVVLTLTAWCKDLIAAADFKSDLLEQSKKRFDAAGIKVPFPHTTVTVTESNRPKPAPPS
jgi:small-conductance mechanosensitive channel